MNNHTGRKAFLPTQTQLLTGVALTMIGACFAFCLPAGAQTSVSHAATPVNNPAAPTTVPPASSPTPVTAAAPAPSIAGGIILGNLVNNDGIPTNTNNYTSGVTITGVRRETGTVFEAKTDPFYGGIFRAENLQPGIYDITVPASYIGATPYTAEQINGVTVTAGQTTTLNVTVYPGTRQLTTGVPAQVSVPVAQQLARNDEYIHQLEVQLDTMRQQIQQLQAQVTALQSRTTTH